MGGGRATNQYTYEKERKSLTQREGGRERENRHNGEYSESVQSRKPMRAKKKRKDGDTGGW